MSPPGCPAPAAPRAGPDAVPAQVCPTTVRSPLLSSRSQCGPPSRRVSSPSSDGSSGLSPCSRPAGRCTSSSADSNRATRGPTRQQHRLSCQRRSGRHIRRQRHRDPEEEGQPHHSTRCTAPHSGTSSAGPPSPTATSRPPTTATTSHSPHPPRPAGQRPADARTRRTPPPTPPPAHKQPRRYDAGAAAAAQPPSGKAPAHAWYGDVRMLSVPRRGFELPWGPGRDVGSVVRVGTRTSTRRTMVPHHMCH